MWASNKEPAAVSWIGAKMRSLDTMPQVPIRRRIMNFTIECEEEVDGRWIAEVPQLPGVLCYGKTADEAMAKAEVLALRAMADRLEQNESRPVDISISLPLAA
jgi:predicted RNase H-like HicB family nuclease